ncbi:hypothetical protein Pmar_PMAR027306, partial [Perkinsus marinus ATCC 50983]
MAALILSTSVALEDMRSQKLTMMEQHKNDLQRRRAEHEAECEAKEEKLKECRRRIRSSPHIDPDLEEATTEAYTQLDAMAAEIENFAKKMLHVHEEYPSSVEVHVEMAWLCDYVHAFRVKLMEFLQCEKEVQLDDSKKAARMGAEMLSYELDDRLRKHNTRKGLVRSEVLKFLTPQIEIIEDLLIEYILVSSQWYEPRLKQIMSHKSKFKRHAVAIAKKSAGQDDRFDALMDTLIEGDKSKDVVLLNLDTCMTFPTVKKSATHFYRVMRGPFDSLREKPSSVEQLIAANSDVIRIQKEQKHEGYSGAEIEFYSAEIAKLDEGLKAKAADRLVQVEELEAAMTNMVERVLEEFEKQRNEVYEEVCIAYGLGKEHVVARRQLREKVAHVNTEAGGMLFATAY